MIKAEEKKDGSVLRLFVLLNSHKYVRNLTIKVTLVRIIFWMICNFLENNCIYSNKMSLNRALLFDI